MIVRLMTGPKSGADRARSSIEHVVALIAERRWINEFKHTSVRR
jgi:hypothetical protein